MEKAITKKYELLKDGTKEVGGDTLYRIRALKDFGDICAGDLGGYIQGEHNLSHSGIAWVYGDARVCGDARVGGDACVGGDAWVGDDACVGGDAWVGDDACVGGDAWVGGDACVCGNARVGDDARVGGNAWVGGDAQIHKNAQINSKADYAVVRGFGTAHRATTFYKTQDRGIAVKCGCFCASLDEFRAQVKVTRSGKIAKEYLALADLMEMHFKEE